MTVIRDSLRAFAAGAAVCCLAYAAFALPSETGETHVGIDNFTFKPDTITVPVGTKLVWKNEDDIPHSIVESSGKFHSQALDTDDSYGFTFTIAGTFEYFCGLHPFMKAKVVVAP